MKKDYYLMDVWRGRLQFPDLKRKLIQLAKHYDVNTLLIEKAGLGLSLVDDLRNGNEVIRPIGIVPKGDKIDRLVGVTSMIEAGQVYLPKDASWLDTFMHELLGFPNTKYDDQVDSVSQFLEWSRNNQRHNSRIPVGPKLFVMDPPSLY